MPSWSTLASSLTLVLLLAAPVAFSQTAPPTTLEGHPWLETASDPAALFQALETHPEKVPPEFYDRLQYAMPDDTLRVMVALTDRTPALESYVADHAVTLDWYGDAPRYLARVTADDVAPLLTHPAVAFVEPDYPLTHFLAESVLDVDVRAAQPGDGNGVWSYDAAGGPMGLLRSEHPSFLAPLTGAGVTVAIIDGGLDTTHRDFGGWDCAAGAYAACDDRIDANVAIDQVVAADSTATCCPPPRPQAATARTWPASWPETATTCATPPRTTGTAATACRSAWPRRRAS